MKIPICCCTALLLAVAIHAQPMPAETASAIPIDPDAPGLAYTPTQMWKRLLAIAEGPIPTREALEREFGFKFWLRESPADEREGKVDFSWDTRQLALASSQARESATNLIASSACYFGAGGQLDCVRRRKKAKTQCIQNRVPRSRSTAPRAHSTRPAKAESICS